MSLSEEQRDRKVIRALDEIAAQLVQLNKSLSNRSTDELVEEILNKIEDLRIGHVHGSLTGPELNVALYNLIRQYRGEK